MHPLDLIKTRLQMQRLPPGKVVSPSEMHLYSGIGDCFRKMYQSEGFFSFWKGVIPPILAETPKRAVKVSIFCFKKLQCILFLCLLLYIHNSHVYLFQFFTFEQYKQFFLFGSPVPTPTVSLWFLIERAPLFEAWCSVTDKI